MSKYANPEYLIDWECSKCETTGFDYPVDLTAPAATSTADLERRHAEISPKCAAVNGGRFLGVKPSRWRQKVHD